MNARNRRPPWRRQRGVALLTAILLVALATILAATIGYENAMTARRGTGTFAFDQSLQVAMAAEAIAAYALRESRKLNPAVTAPGQPWSTPYGPVDLIPGVTLEAWLEDAQGRFNLNNLINADGSTNPAAVQIFENLLTNLGLETRWAPMMADWIDSDSIPNNPDGAEDSVYLSQMPPYRTANMMITSASEILALPGFGRDRYLRLAPFITALPTGTGTNLCSAPMQVLNALGPPGTANFTDPQSLAKSRQDGCFPNQQQFDQLFNNDQSARQAADAMVGTVSNFFTLTSIVTIGSTQFALYSLMHQEGDQRVRTIQRSFTAD
ncbi:MAG TPA: type II secretion system minor pseudopilin GspK [Steroidobacteraceae bacterium]|nr:type II secretion system minor pseudopilin GspK [Steroidobacteraceae bacterium]